MSAARNNGSAAASSSGVFTLTIVNAAGEEIILNNCTGDTLVFELIHRLRKINPKSKKEPVITIRHVNDNGTGFYKELIPNMNLRDNKITGPVELMVVYEDVRPSCLRLSPINEPFFEKLHKWIESKQIEFNTPFKPLNTNNGQKMHDFIKGTPPPESRRSTKGTTLLADYNDWKFDREILFFLSASQPHNFEHEGKYDSDTMRAPVKYMLDSIQEESPHLEYTKSGLFSDITDIRIPIGSSVRGTLNKINLLINQIHNKDGISEDMICLRRCRIIVGLQGYIEIRGPDGKLIHVDTTPFSECYIPYEQIIMCNPDGSLPGITEENISKVVSFQGNANSNKQGIDPGPEVRPPVLGLRPPGPGLGLRFGFPPAGGKRRTRRLKRSKRSKRSKNKKTRGHSRK